MKNTKDLPGGYGSGGYMRGELVDWTFHGRPDDAVLHSMWHWELESGEYFQAVKK